MGFSYRKDAPTWMTKDSAKALLEKSKALRIKARETREASQRAREERAAAYSGPERRKTKRLPSDEAWSDEQRHSFLNRFL